MYGHYKNYVIICMESLTLQYTQTINLSNSLNLGKNPNTKLKRWKNFIAEFGADIRYKPGLQNVVADALSRHQINNITNGLTVNFMNTSLGEKIKRVVFPLNGFKNQIEIVKSNEDSIESKTTFHNHENYKIKFKIKNKLIENIKSIISEKHINAIYCLMETFDEIEKGIFNAFPNNKFVYTTSKLKDVTNLIEQIDIVEEIHNRAHRNAINNFNEARRMFYWPNMKKDFQKWVRMCEICKTQKYERVPTKQLIGSTPIPQTVGESISMDLFYIDNKQYVTSVDRYSKYLTIHTIESKLNFQEKLEEILTQNYPNCKYLITDNEPILTSNAANIVYMKYNIKHIKAPIMHSTSNGQVERTHSTLIEIIRCLNKQNNTNSSEEIFNAVRAYNETIHSVTGEKPSDVKQNPRGYPKISEKLLNNQNYVLKYHNMNRENKHFEPNEIIYVKGNRRRKDANAYTKHIVKENLKDTIITKKNKLIHKDSIRTNKT